MEIKKVRLVNSNMSVAIDYLDESGQEHLLIVGAEKVVQNWQAVEHHMHTDAAYVACPHRARVNHPAIGEIVECEFAAPVM